MDKKGVMIMDKLELGENGIENGVEVVHTGGSIYHLTDDNGHYDEKICGGSNGSYDVFKTNDDWKTHSHTHFDENGHTTYDRPADQDSDEHPWETRIDD